MSDNQGVEVGMATLYITPGEHPGGTLCPSLHCRLEVLVPKESANLPGVIARVPLN